MNIPFFYEPNLDSGLLQLSESNKHYMLQVLRMKENEQFYLTNGQGQKCLAVLKHVSKKNCEVEILESTFESPRKTKLHLKISFTKNPSRMEWLLEKVTEMGIESITPLITQRSEKIFLKKERFEKILIAAMLQSQQCYLPVLSEPTALKELVSMYYEQKCIAYCGPEFEKQTAFQTIKPQKETLFLIGPEGDFTADEVHLCLQNKYEVIQLGRNRLRTETAGLYVCTLFNAIQ
jgi:16S rRNA (uracil1498-N3)-methyltransferase